MGCGVLFLLVTFLGGGIIFYGIRQVMRNLSVEPVNVAAIADPPKNATPDQVLPSAVGKYVRELLTSDTAAIEKYESTLFRRNSTVEMQAGSAPNFPTEGLFGVYKDDHNKLALVGAGMAAKIQKPAHQFPWQKTPVAADADNSSGTRMLMKISDNMAWDWTIWTKENWGYVVFTTNTATLDFVKSFSYVEVKSNKINQ
jgi:hypothetical protein